MKKLLALILALSLTLAFAACGSEKKNTSSAKKDAGNTAFTEEDTKPAGDAVSSTDWPTNTIFPKPEGCKIVEVKSEGGKNYITVEWDSLDAAKAYIEIAKQTEGEGAEVIAGYNDDATAVYGTYAITITSLNEPENLVLYK
ncbi:MAG: hypothetical protein MJ132_06420 [Clostridia bacterium]|nr:hypothetical protein [Clostridia bacterium]